MSKKEAIASEVARLPDADLDRLLEFLRSIRQEHEESRELALASEASLAKDWLSPEEDAAWANL